MITYASTKQASEILGVSQNTVRKWDKEGKIKSEKTEGGHRKFPVDLLNQFVMNNIEKTSKKKEKSNIFIPSDVEYGDKVLELLLETAELFQQCDTCHSKIKGILPEFVKSIWNKIKYKKMVPIQPMLGPTALIFYKDWNSGQIESMSIAAKTEKYETNVHKLMLDDFENNKDMLSSVLAAEIDGMILSKLIKINKCDFTELIWTQTIGIKASELSPVQFFGLKEVAEKFNYFMTFGEENIKFLRSLPFFKNKDIYQIPPILNEKTFHPISIAGHYSNEVFGSKDDPFVFCPYSVFSIAPENESGNHTALIRYAWAEIKQSDE